MTVESPRTLVLLRHAKADWPTGPDHERPLAERGRLDAHAAGRRLADDGIAPDLVLCSTATRTRETWKLAAHELPHRPRTVYEERLYEAGLGDLLTLIGETGDDIASLLVVAHNPGMHALTEALAGSADKEPLARVKQAGFPTAAFAVLTLAGGWKSAEHGAAHLAGFWTPHE